MQTEPLAEWRKHSFTILLITCVFLVNATSNDVPQSLLHNYVGRQIPTAMVSRNLARGSGFLSPQLDSGPFPNLFLVEPPIYAQFVAWTHTATGVSLERCGQWISYLGIALAIWGLIGLDEARGDLAFPILAAMTFAFLPVCLRFTRSFQPDVLALGLVMAGMRSWDVHQRHGGRARLIAGWALLALGLATKILTAYIFLPLLMVILQPRQWRRIVLALSTLLPAFLWYVYAAMQLRQGGGSRASADNASHWMHAMSLAPWFDPATYRSMARAFFWRAFGPMAIAVGLLATLTPNPRDRLWRAWGLSAAIMLAVLAGKAHHEYYWLALAPVVAVAFSRGLPTLQRILLSVTIGREQARAVPSLFIRESRREHAARVPYDSATAIKLVITIALLAAVYFVAEFWGMAANSREKATPAEWKAWPQAVEAIQKANPPGVLLVAPEALLYLADRKGCRLEYEPKSRIRAAGEWGEAIDPIDPLALVELYRSKGAKFVCDLWPAAGEPDRRLLQDSIRRRYKVLVDRDGVILAELVDRE